MGQLTDYLENGLDHTAPGKALDARVGREIARTTIPKLSVKIIKELSPNGTPGERRISVQHQTNVNAEFLSLNPVIVLMRKKNITSLKGALQKAANKWVQAGASKSKVVDNTGWSRNYLGEALTQFNFRTEVSDYYLSNLGENNVTAVTVEELMNGFIIKGIKEDDVSFLSYAVMGASKNVPLVGSGVLIKTARYGLAVRIDNPKFIEVQGGPESPYLSGGCSMFRGEPKYLYGDICKIGFRIVYNVKKEFTQHIIV
ncbi:MAG: hypothetical protein WCL70_04130 [Paludibacter sp.]